MAATLKVVLTTVVCLLGVASAATTDRLLPSSGQSCIDLFNSVKDKHYASDAVCADLIKTSFSVTGQQCPDSKPGSQVQKCLSKTSASSLAWEEFIKKCEVLNVAKRTGAGEAEAENTKRPSCFQAFDNLDAFKTYVGTKSNGSCGRTLSWLVPIVTSISAIMMSL